MSKKVIIIISVVAVVLGCALGIIINSSKTSNIPKKIIEVNVSGSLNTEKDYLKKFNMTDKEIADVVENADDYQVAIYKVKMFNESKKDLVVNDISAKSEDVKLWVMNDENAQKISIKSGANKTEFVIVAVKNSNGLKVELKEYLKENTSFSIKGE